ncbi:MAG: lactate utilization protein [Deltaproteobacteria bacterium]|nr:lactate utilization protein [Deltaproteobacteria bacterium]MBW1909545.1 lactate utilization protein [Deltaproteobacteria bacterium]MBW2032636.1 lactate utilization protein [Deltaproteobacteria bacterium]MBW2114035.1 lactate utilization protein [Deltaproteobacteria bacterium]MBW2167948.1 lactate utilization protein [Deltaproteobacteria bacterium]
MENDYQTWLWEKLAEKCIENLKKHGFDAHFVATSEDARELVLNMVSSYQTFGLGGSDTTRALGLLEELKAKGKTIHDHWQKDLSKEEDLDIRLNQGRCDCFFCSANAISITGEVVNVDGIGNRTNAMCFGPKKVVVIAGMNKVTPDIESALKRVRDIAGPMRAKSLGMDTPCAETGICNDCNSPQRICRITTILHRKPMLTDITVILVNEALGF